MVSRECTEVHIKIILLQQKTINIKNNIGLFEKFYFIYQLYKHENIYYTLIFADEKTVFLTNKKFLFPFTNLYK